MLIIGALIMEDQTVYLLAIYTRHTFHTKMKQGIVSFMYLAKGFLQTCKVVCHKHKFRNIRRSNKYNKKVMGSFKLFQPFKPILHTSDQIST